MAVACCCLDQKRFQFQATSFVSRVKEILALFKDSLWRLHYYSLFSSHQTIVKSYRQALLIIKINVLFLNMRLSLFKTAVVSPEEWWTWLEASWKKTWPLKVECSVGLVQKYPLQSGEILLIFLYSQLHSTFDHSGNANDEWSISSQWNEGLIKSTLHSTSTQSSHWQWSQR